MFKSGGIGQLCAVTKIVKSTDQKDKNVLRFQMKLERCLSEGHILLIEDMAEEIDPSID